MEQLSFIKRILPSHYTVTVGKAKNSIHCRSEIGIRKPPYLNESTGNMITDAEDEEHWDYIVRAIKQQYPHTFQEIFHNTCFCHTDFTVYIKF